MLTTRPTHNAPCTSHHSADARTALMATYIARYANPRAGMRAAPQSKAMDVYKGTEGTPFGARGRTIYNADAYPTEQCDALRELARIDAEEERRRRYGEQFLMAARGDFEASSSSVSVSAAEMAVAEEMFALYIAI